MRLRYLIMIAGALTLLAQAQTQAQSYVDYTGGTYLQTFDSLVYSNNLEVNTSDPVTINGTEYTFGGASSNVFDFAAPVDSSETIAGSVGGLGLSDMAGWYGGAAFGTKYGATSGGQTTGGDLSFGPSNNTYGVQSDRALGLIATSTTSNAFFTVKLENDTGSDIFNINLSFVGELWRQSTKAQPISFGYVVTNMLAPVSMSTNFLTNLGSVNFATAASGSAFATNGQLSLSQTNISLSNMSVGDWANGSALWITFETTATAANLSGAQGIGIDNFSLAVVPEASTITLVGLGLIGMLAIRRRHR